MMITREEFLEMAADLDMFHGIFSRLWYVGMPVEDSSIATACVRYDRKGNYFSFCFNPDYYKSLDHYNRKFVICHEMLHLILNHGKRGLNHDPKIANIAMDVVVNEALVREFNFDRTKIKDWQVYCWYDTTFAGMSVQKDKNFEFYYDILASIKNNNGQGPLGKNYKGDRNNPGNGTITVDEHNGFEMDGDGLRDKACDSTLADAIDKLSTEELRDLKKKLSALLDPETTKEINRGDEAGGLIKILSVSPVAKKQKWETVIRQWVLSKIKRDDRLTEQWARINRRFVTLSRDLFIPTEMEIETDTKKKDRIKVLFFLDTSGSCAGLAERFWKAAKSLPEDKFELHLHCFDVQVYETTLASGKLYGFGGTRFDILEIKAQAIKIKDGRYPDAIFIITDGMGTSVTPEFPEKWYWFLSYNYRTCIPKECNIFSLADYE